MAEIIFTESSVEERMRMPMGWDEQSVQLFKWVVEKPNHGASCGGNAGDASLAR